MDFNKLVIHGGKLTKISKSHENSFRLGSLMTPKLKSTCPSAKLALHLLHLSDPYKAVPCGNCFETVKDVHQDKVTAYW